METGFYFYILSGEVNYMYVIKFCFYLKITVHMLHQIDYN